MKKLTIESVQALLKTGITFAPLIQNRLDTFIKANPEHFLKEIKFLEDPKRHKKYLKAIAGVESYIKKPFKYTKTKKEAESREEFNELLKIHHQAEKERKESIQKEKEKIWTAHYPDLPYS